MGQLVLHVRQGRGLRTKSSGVYVTVKLGEQSAKSEVASTGGSEIELDARFTLELDSPNESVQILVWGYKPAGNDSYIGQYALPVKKVVEIGTVEGWFLLQKRSTHGSISNRFGGEIQVHATYMIKKGKSESPVGSPAKKEERDRVFFGTSLEAILKRSDNRGRNVPYVLDELLSWLSKNGLKTEGLFRISCRKMELTQLMSLIDREGQRAIVTEFDNRNTKIHLFATLLKQFFVRLPQPFLPSDFFADLNPETPNVSRFKQLVSALDAPTGALLRRLLVFLHEAAKKSKDNLMSSHNLAVVFFPVFCGGSSGAFVAAEKVQRGVSGLTAAIDMFAFDDLPAIEAPKTSPTEDPPSFEEQRWEYTQTQSVPLSSSRRRVLVPKISMDALQSQQVPATSDSENGNQKEDQNAQSPTSATVANQILNVPTNNEDSVDHSRPEEQDSEDDDRPLPCAPQNESDEEDRPLPTPPEESSASSSMQTPNIPKEPPKSSLPFHIMRRRRPSFNRPATAPELVTQAQRLTGRARRRSSVRLEELPFNVNEEDTTELRLELQRKMDTITQLREDLTDCEARLQAREEGYRRNQEELLTLRHALSRAENTATLLREEVASLSDTKDSGDLGDTPRVRSILYESLATIRSALLETAASRATDAEFNRESKEIPRVLTALEEVSERLAGLQEDWAGQLRKVEDKLESEEAALAECDQERDNCRKQLQKALAKASDEAMATSRWREKLKLLEEEMQKKEAVWDRHLHLLQNQLNEKEAALNAETRAIQALEKDNLAKEELWQQRLERQIAEHSQESLKWRDEFQTLGHEMEKKEAFWKKELKRTTSVLRESQSSEVELKKQLEEVSVGTRKAEQASEKRVNVAQSVIEKLENEAAERKIQLRDFEGRYLSSVESEAESRKLLAESQQSVSDLTEVERNLCKENNILTRRVAFLEKVAAEKEAQANNQISEAAREGEASLHQKVVELRKQLEDTKFHLEEAKQQLSDDSLKYDELLQKNNKRSERIAELELLLRKKTEDYLEQEKSFDAVKAEMNAKIRKNDDDIASLKRELSKDKTSATDDCLPREREMLLLEKIQALGTQLKNAENELVVFRSRTESGMIQDDDEYKKELLEESSRLKVRLELVEASLKEKCVALQACESDWSKRMHEQVVSSALTEGELTKRVQVLEKEISDMELNSKTKSDLVRSQQALHDVVATENRVLKSKVDQLETSISHSEREKSAMTDDRTRQPKEYSDSNAIELERTRLQVKRMEDELQAKDQALLVVSSQLSTSAMQPKEQSGERDMANESELACQLTFAQERIVVLVRHLQEKEEALVALNTRLTSFVDAREAEELRLESDLETAQTNIILLAKELEKAKEEANWLRQELQAFQDTKPSFDDGDKENNVLHSSVQSADSSLKNKDEGCLSDARQLDSSFSRGEVLELVQSVSAPIQQLAKAHEEIGKLSRVLHEKDVALRERTKSLNEVVGGVEDMQKQYEVEFSVMQDRITTLESQLSQTLRELEIHSGTRVGDEQTTLPTVSLESDETRLLRLHEQVELRDRTIIERDSLVDSLKEMVHERTVAVEQAMRFAKESTDGSGLDSSVSFWKLRAVLLLRLLNFLFQRDPSLQQTLFSESGLNFSSCLLNAQLDDIIAMGRNRSRETAA